jgi:hypothetical protein
LLETIDPGLYSLHLVANSVHLGGELEGQELFGLNAVGEYLAAYPIAGVFGAGMEADTQQLALLESIDASTTSVGGWTIVVHERTSLRIQVGFSLGQSQFDDLAFSVALFADLKKLS